MKRDAPGWIYEGRREPDFGSCGGGGLGAGETFSLEILFLDIDDFRGLVELTLPVRIDRTDALFERRVGGPSAAKVRFESLGEKKVADGGGLVGVDTRAERVAANFAERSGNAFGITGELDGGGIGEIFTLSRNGGLDESSEEVTDVADNHQRDADCENRHDDAAGVFVATGSHARAVKRPEDTASHQPDDENAKE